MRNTFTSGGSARDDRARALIEYARRQAELAQEADPSDTEIALPEDSFPGYTRIEKIHRGGQSIVYMATQASTRRRTMALETIGTTRESTGFLIAYAAMLKDCRWPELHDLTEAVRVCERAAERTDYPAPRTLRLLGMLYAANGRMEQAVATLELALSLPAGCGLPPASVDPRDARSACNRHPGGLIARAYLSKPPPPPANRSGRSTGREPGDRRVVSADWRPRFGLASE